jgi:hypothetical protein
VRNGVKNIQAAAYNGALMVFYLFRIAKLQNILQKEICFAHLAKKFQAIRFAHLAKEVTFLKEFEV